MQASVPTPISPAIKPGSPSGPVWDAAKREPNWLAVRLDARSGQPDKLDKVPLNAQGTNAAKGNDANLTFDEACSLSAKLNRDAGNPKPFTSGSYCIGYRPRTGSALVAVDLDNCVHDDGTVKDWARPLLSGFTSYAERSPSGRGLRLLLARPPEQDLHFHDERSRAAVGGDKREGIGLFAAPSHFVTVTGTLVAAICPQASGAIGPEPATLRAIVGAMSEAGSRKAEQAAAALGWAASGPANAPGAPSKAPAQAPGATGGAEWWRALPEARQADLIRDALAHVDPEHMPYDDWLSVMQGIHATEHPEAWELADAWCARDMARYDPAKNKDRWDGFRAGGGVTLGTVLNMALKAGWRGEGSYRFEASPLGATAPNPSQAAPPALIRPTPFNWSDPATIPPREWLYGHHLIRGFVATTVAPGGLGKSSLAIVEALAMTTGKSLMGDRVPHPLRVWIWNGEDPREELQRRIIAACRQHGLSPADIGDRLLVDSGRDLPITLASEGRDGLIIARHQIDALVKALVDGSVDVLIVDPFVATHAVNENDNTAINAVVSAYREVADRANCAIELVHHVSKAGAMDGDGQGINAARGASALIGAVRSGRYLVRMTEKEALRLGVTDRRSYMRIESGKANLAPLEAARWARIESVPLGNGTSMYPSGDHVGVCVPWTPPAAADSAPADLWERVCDAIDSASQPPRESEKSPDWVGALIAEVWGLDIGAGMTNAQRTPAQTSARASVSRLIKEWRTCGALRVEQRYDQAKGRSHQVILPGQRPAAWGDGLIGDDTEGATPAPPPGFFD